MAQAWVCGGGREDSLGENASDRHIVSSSKDHKDLRFAMAYQGSRW